MSDRLSNLLSAKEVKEYLHVSNQKLYELLADKTFPSFKIGKQYWIIEDEFILWLKNQTKYTKYDRHN